MQECKCKFQIHENEVVASSMPRAKWGSIRICGALQMSLEGDPGSHEYGGEGDQQAS